MRLLEAVIDANHRALAGDEKAGLHPADFADELPMVALTCIDPRLNALLPGALGVPEDKFIWLRNAGNIITGPLSSTMRSLALACAVKGGKEIAIIGHSDCAVSKTSMMQLLESLRRIGVERHVLPDNLNEYFGIFSSERQNVIKACEIVRQSPLIGPKIPVHGLLVDIGNGKVEWLVNGYDVLQTFSSKWQDVVKSTGQTIDAVRSLSDFKIGEMKFPETKIGEIVTRGEDWLSQQVHKAAGQKAHATAEEPPPAPGPIPIPPRIRQRVHVRRS